ncbi:MAG: nucleotide sugar dehydrogenase [Thermodesulfovibrionia bacterium]
MKKGIFREFLDGRRSIAVVGLGYVGVSLLVEFGRRFKVIGFDTNGQRIDELSRGFDRTGEASKRDLSSKNIYLTNNPDGLRDASLIIIAVPTPIDEHKIPDLSLIRKASEIVGENLKKGAIVVYESTVYPGVTEDVCVPILEKASGMRCGEDFKVGYSPERVNPGDKAHGITNIVKVVSAQDKETLDLLCNIYGSVVKAGIYRAPDIKTAEAAKVIENIQRDLNIALINELSIIFNRMGLDTQEVLKAAQTKWNFLPFKPGLVGGHCIGVDPYYLTFKAQELGYHPEVILAGRRINDNMGIYVAENTVKQLIHSGRSVRDSKVLIMGITFKEDINDIRNTRVIDIYNELRGLGVKPFIHDPYADKGDVYKEYKIQLLNGLGDKRPYDGIIIAVSHRPYQRLSLNYLKGLCNGSPVLIDVKAIFKRGDAVKAGFSYWRL